MENLANSIREHGILQPVLLRETEEAERYELVAGERRWRAAQRAGLTQIPALVRVLDDRQSLELAIIENVQRHDISAIDTALAYQKLAQEFHLSQDDIAKRVGKSRSAIANTLRLLDLPEEVRKAIEDGTLSEGHGRAILGAPGEGARRAIFRRVVRDQLSVRDTERLSSKARPDGNAAENPANTPEDGGGSNSKKGAADMPHTQAELRDLEHHIEKALGLRVSIRAKGNAGALLIHYMSSDDLERLRHLLSRAG
jgi:ParB family chromosome partitioning protein